MEPAVTAVTAVGATVFDEFFRDGNSCNRYRRRLLLLGWKLHQRTS